MRAIVKDKTMLGEAHMVKEPFSVTRREPMLVHMGSSITGHNTQRVATRRRTRWGAILVGMVALTLLGGHYPSQAAEPAKQGGTTAPAGKVLSPQTAPPTVPMRTAPIPAAGPPLTVLPGEFAIQTVLKGNYLTAVGGGGRITDVVHTDATQPRSWEKFRLWVDLGSGYNPPYAIQTTSGRYLTAVGGGGRTTDVVHTDATQIAAWEKFRLLTQVGPSDYGAYAIQTARGNYLTATGGGGHKTDPPAVHTDATHIGSWETFWLLKCADLGSGSLPNLNIMYRISIRPGS